MRKTDKNAPKDRADHADGATTPPEKAKSDEAYRQYLNYIMYCDAYP